MLSIQFSINNHAKIQQISDQMIDVVVLDQNPVHIHDRHLGLVLTPGLRIADDLDNHPKTDLSPEMLIVDQLNVQKMMGKKRINQLRNNKPIKV